MFFGRSRFLQLARLAWRTGERGVQGGVVDQLIKVSRAGRFCGLFCPRPAGRGRLSIAAGIFICSGVYLGCHVHAERTHYRKHGFQGWVASFAERTVKLFP